MDMAQEEDRRFIPACTEESGQLKFNTKLAPGKSQQNSGGVGLGLLVGTQ